MLHLDWPLESTMEVDPGIQWQDNNANVVLDFHGDPVNNALTVLSDGNHHMALEAVLSEYSKSHLQGEPVFYVTLPPSVLLTVLHHGKIRIGNLCFPVEADALIGPIEFISKATPGATGIQAFCFARSRGNSLLVRKGNPTGIRQVSDIINSDARFFISNPEREGASYQVYSDTLRAIAIKEGISTGQFDAWLNSENTSIVYGNRVHHREAPEALASGEADCTLVYHHLALRYTTVFPDEFELLTVSGSGSVTPAPEQLCTEYFVSSAREAASPRYEQATRFIEFMKSVRVREIYNTYGLS